MNNPFNQILTVLSYIWGSIVEDWVSVQDQKLERCLLALNHINYVPDTQETLWDEFETVFKSAWKYSE